MSARYQARDNAMMVKEAGICYKAHMIQRGLCWLRRDLRLQDHVALHAAWQDCAAVAVLFVFDQTLLQKLKNPQDRRLTFIHRSLQELDATLKSYGSRLIVRYGQVRQEVLTVAKSLGCSTVFANEDEEPYAKKRDAQVAQILKDQGINLRLFKDQVIFSGSDISKDNGEAYQMFTPYKKAWLARFHEGLINDYSVSQPNFLPAKELQQVRQPWSLSSLGFDTMFLWLEPGEQGAWRRLETFAVDLYHQQRDFPAMEGGTSGLSVHLRFGTISIRALLRWLFTQRSQGRDVWLSELIWREFYHMILDRFPHVVETAFKPAYQHMRWPGSLEFYEKWTQGLTGYPLVDGAMRLFAKTGWMHNRLRMVVASFLTKDLLVDWRQGEAWFARNLLDFDLAANNGGWQWSASTGCDAQPYFRIFNPISQSLKFDTEGQFIRQHLPELEHVPLQYLHSPWLAPLDVQRQSHCIIGRDYPKPLVDHGRQRQKALLLLSAKLS